VARKKRKKSDDYSLPQFDERDFMRTEMRNALMMVGAVFLAALMAIMAGCLTWVLKDARIPFVLGMLGFLLLRFLYTLMKLDTSDIEKSKWAGTLFSYFLTFIAIWVLLINPPIVDLIPPDIVDLTPDIQEMESEVHITILVEDNQEIEQAVLFLTYPNGSYEDGITMEKLGRNKFRYTVTHVQSGKYEYDIETKDPAEHTDHDTFSFEVVPHDPPSVALWGEPPRISSDDLKVEIKDNSGIVLAWYQIDDGPEKKITIEDPRYTIQAIRPKGGWTYGNHTVNVCAMDQVPHQTTCVEVDFIIGGR
jgi:hypothetical protein